MSLSLRGKLMSCNGAPGFLRKHKGIGLLLMADIEIGMQASLGLKWTSCGGPLRVTPQLLYTQLALN